MTTRWQNLPLGAIPSGDSPRDLRLGLYVDKPRLFDSMDVPAMPDLAAIPLLGGGLPQPDADPLYNDVAGCHDAATEVLTDKGWCMWSSYNGHDLLGTMNRSNGELEFQAPTALVRYDYDGPMYFTEHASMDFALTPNHRLWCSEYLIPRPYASGSAGYGPRTFRTMDDLPTRLSMPAATTGFRGTELKRLRIGDREWDGDDFLAFLALVISDGWVDGPETKHSSPVISFCCFREDRREMVAELARRLEIRELPGRKGVWNLYGDRALVEWMRANAYTGPTLRAQFKRVPDIVKVCNQNQIARFLKFFGDQHVRQDDGRRSFYSSSRRLIDDLQELLLRIGKRGGISERAARPNKLVPGAKGTEYTLTERQIGDICLTRLNRLRQIEVDSYRGEVFCAEVPNSTLVTRRNGKVLISGNSCVISAAAHHVNLTAQHAGLGKLVTADMVRDAYATLTGYDPTTGAGDNGAVPRLFFAAWKAGRLNLGCKLLAYGRVNKDDLDEITLATALFGGTLGAYDLPLISQGQADNQGRPQWFRPTGGWPEHQGPGTWGAHMIYHHGIRTGNTWGVSVVEDPEWHRDCCFELWFALLDISRLATGRAVNGFEFDKLLADAEARSNE